MEEKNKLTVVFSEPYTFEDKEYTEIDLSGLRMLNANDGARAKAMLDDPAVTVLELDLMYNLMLASLATKLPAEFFKQLPLRDATSVKAVVMDYFL